MKIDRPGLAARWFALALCVPAAGGVAAETYDIATFEPPSGWERVSSPSLLLLRAPSGDAQIALFPSFRSVAAPAANFEAEWEKLVTSALGATDAPQIATQVTPDGWTALIGAVTVTRDGATFTVLQATTTGFDRAMSIVAHIAAAERAADVTAFFERLELNAEPPSAAAAPPAVDRGSSSASMSASAPESVTTIAPAGFVNGRPNGLFYRTTVTALGGSRVELDVRLFLPGDRITRMFPFGGAETFDASRCLPDSCGTYTLDGSVLTVRWDDGRTDRWAFARTPEGFSLDGAPFRLARSLSAASLVGEWGGAQSGGNPFSNVYRFERDGSFTFGAAGGRTAGRYDVRGLTLILEFADGSVSRRTLFAASSGDPVGLIGVDGDVYARR